MTLKEKMDGIDVGLELHERRSFPHPEFDPLPARYEITYKGNFLYSSYDKEEAETVFLMQLAEKLKSI